jgi:hypothetical protein
MCSSVLAGIKYNSNFNFKVSWVVFPCEVCVESVGNFRSRSSLGGCGGGGGGEVGIPEWLVWAGREGT